MQTFLPYSDYQKSADVLDKRRKGKQRVEVVQILDILVGGKESSWSNHPAVKMWKGYERELCKYGLAVCRSWKEMGCEDNCEGIIKEYRIYNTNCPKPPFIGNEEFHASHRAALLYKGWLDLTCTAIPKPVDEWLADNSFPKKSEFRTVRLLKDLQDYFNYHPTFGDSYYKLRTNWGEKPCINYVWSV